MYWDKAAQIKYTFSVSSLSCTTFITPLFPGFSLHVEMRTPQLPKIEIHKIPKIIYHSMPEITRELSGKFSVLLFRFVYLCIPGGLSRTICLIDPNLLLRLKTTHKNNHKHRRLAMKRVPILKRSRSRKKEKRKIYEPCK